MPLKSVRITEQEIRKLFNDGLYWSRAKQGDLRQILIKEKHPSPPRSSEPICTLSQILSYVDATDNEVALVHQYLRPDKTLGASGIPDPKRLLKEDILYFI